MGKAAQPGQRVDTLGLEQTLDNISFVLPISLSLSVRQVDADQVNLVINVEPKVAVEPGALRSTAIQVNNYGLRQYGRIEALGVLTFNGWTPDSSATFTAQGAEGLTYARMDYEAPSESLGGVNGVRAYTTADGVGDAGALASVEVRQQYSPEGAVGVFYDGGVVNQNRHPVAGQYNATYSLQAVGFTWVGVVSRDVNYNTSIAKAVGRYAAYVPGIYETAPHALRLNFALSYLF